ncbi:thermonuclease family protein [Rhizobium tropici]|nr:thermonuclease family protein [Rhizobium tropici]
MLPHAGLAQSTPKHFTICEEGIRRIDCVVDGDTFWMDGIKIRIADIDAPETHPARCDSEQQLGDAATRRLQDLLNAGPFELAAADRDQDLYGRKLRIVERDSQSIGVELVSEGLARKWEGHRRPWCY